VGARVRDAGTPKEMKPLPVVQAQEQGDRAAAGHDRAGAKETSASVYDKD